MVHIVVKTNINERSTWAQEFRADITHPYKTTLSSLHSSLSGFKKAAVLYLCKALKSDDDVLVRRNPLTLCTPGVVTHKRQHWYLYSDIPANSGTNLIILVPTLIYL